MGGKKHLRRNSHKLQSLALNYRSVTYRENCFIGIHYCQNFYFLPPTWLQLPGLDRREAGLCTQRRQTKTTPKTIIVSPSLDLNLRLQHPEMRAIYKQESF